MPELILTYTAGTFGIDDTGMVKISWRTTSDMGKPQFDRSRGGELHHRRGEQRRQARSVVRPAQHPAVGQHAAHPRRPRLSARRRYADGAHGRPPAGLARLSPADQLREHVSSSERRSMPSRPTSSPSCRSSRPSISCRGRQHAGRRSGLRSRSSASRSVSRSSPRTCWGNPTADAERTLSLVPSRPIRGSAPSASRSKRGDGPRVLDNLVVDAPGDVELRLVAERRKSLPAPIRCASLRPRRCGATGATCTGRAARPSAWARRKAIFAMRAIMAFVDIVGHQGNDFQITDAFWAELNRLTAAFDVPGRFVCVPGYEWSGNTGMGGDRNIFYRREGRPIRRSSHILVEGADLEPAPMLHRGRTLSRARRRGRGGDRPCRRPLRRHQVRP